MKRYELQKIGAPGLVYLEESDILDVRPLRGNDLYALEIILRDRECYTVEDGFRYDGRNRSVSIRLSLRQARELIEQDRAAQGKDFCEGCFDFGASVEPEQCARCRTLLALARAGHGDMRKVRIPLPSGPSYALPIALVVLLALWVWTLNAWSAAATERDQARQELAAVRRMKQPSLR